MKIKSSSLCLTLALTGAVFPFASPAKAQNAVTPGASGRLSVVELRDTTLADALELIFQAAGKPSHIIDESASLVQIPSVTLNNIAWDAAVRNLANLNNFKVSRNETGAWVVEPRAPVVPADGSGFPNPDGNFGQPSPFPGGVPSNPFGVAPGAGGRNRNRPRTQASPSVRTFSNAQTRGNFGGGRTNLNPNEGKDYRVIIVYHIYAGGLAKLFQNSSVISTDEFVSPESAGGNGNGGGGGGGRGSRNGGGGGSGFSTLGGGGGGGFGGGGGGFGGGGFGGSTGGFGGSTGGFGGGFGF
jgi:hypothetical protein